MELALAPATAALVVAGLGVEQRLFARSRTPSRREAIAWSIGWLLLAVVVAAGIALTDAIALILGFVGIKILVADVVHISDLGSLVVIAVLIGGGIVASLVADRLDPPHPLEEAERRPPRCPRELTPRNVQLQHSARSRD